MQIWGAGLSGLIAACAWPQADIYEAQPRSSFQTHKALLRFRSTAVADLTGIEFRKVRVHKGLWSEGKFVPPSILLANQYSMKVMGRLADRSVWHLDPVDRFIAPEDFIEQLIHRHNRRIAWGQPGSLATLQLMEQVVSTVPMGVMLKLIAETSSRSPEEYWPTFPKMERKAITVQRWRIPGADVFQTIYFPDPRYNMYRASITGDVLIAEAMGDVGGMAGYACEAFGLNPDQLEPLDKVKQSYGKIAPIENGYRSNFILDLSMNHNVFSLGRFATWRNILLDDVVNDIAVIRRLMNSNGYERTRAAAK